MARVRILNVPNDCYSYARSRIIVRSAPCFESLTVTTVSNNSVSIATREGCEVVIEMSQLAFQVWDLINIICILTMDVTVSNESDVSEKSEQLSQLVSSVDSKISCSNRDPMKIRTLWSHSAKSAVFLASALNGWPSAVLSKSASSFCSPYSFNWDSIRSVLFFTLKPCVSW